MIPYHTRKAPSPAKKSSALLNPHREVVSMVASPAADRVNPTTANLARIDEWLDLLANEVDVAAHSEELTLYLQTLARFWTYSARNCWLITIQMPEARRVASRKTWESLGRTIKRDQWRRGLEILCPHFRKVKDEQTGEEREALTHFSTGWVFDISQTEGRPLAQPVWQQTTGDYNPLYGALIERIRRSGLTVEERDDLPDGVHGYSTGRGTIAVSTSDSLGNRCQTLLHELCHERCHDIRARQTFNRAMLECQAESVSYCCCQAFEIPTPNTPTYLALYNIDRSMLIANLEAIRAGVAHLMRELGCLLESVVPAA